MTRWMNIPIFSSVSYVSSTGGGFGNMIAASELEARKQESKKQLSFFSLVPYLDLDLDFLSNADDDDDDEGDGEVGG